MSKDVYRDWQAAIVSVLIEKTDEITPKISKANLAESIGISFPTLKKIYKGQSDLTMPIFWAWANEIELSTERVIHEARHQAIYQMDDFDPPRPEELIMIMPKEVQESICRIMESIAANLYAPKGVKAEDCPKPMDRERLERVKLLNNSKTKPGRELEQLRESAL